MSTRLPGIEICHLPRAFERRDERPRGARAPLCRGAEQIASDGRLAGAALAQAGYAVLQMDLLGCGDSAGSLAMPAGAMGRRRRPWPAGCNIATLRPPHLPPFRSSGFGAIARARCWRPAAAELGSACNFLLWQPTLAGRTLLQQFLRLKSVGQLATGQAKGVVQELRDQLAAGRSVEVAGYTLHPALCRGLDEAVLTPPPFDGSGSRLEWFEVSPSDVPRRHPLRSRMLRSGAAAAGRRRPTSLADPPSGRPARSRDAPALLEASAQALAEG
jgi:hypothetical protein